jgi:hypothetical protein
MRPKVSVITAKSDRVLSGFVMTVTRPAERSSRTWPRGAFSGRAWWVISLVVIGAGLFTVYLHQARITPVNSDAAAIALQAWDMLHGNVGLHGWLVADVSFYTTELPEYALVELFAGLRPDVVHISAALTYTLIVLLTALVARGRTRGAEGVLRALIAGTIVVAPSLMQGSRVLLLSANHTGTAVPVLAALLILDRCRPRWHVPVMIGLVLVLAQVGDQIATYAMALPLALVAAVRAVRLRSRYEGWLAVAAAVSAAAAPAIMWLIHAAGGFYQPSLHGKLLAPPSQLPANLRAVGTCVLILFGVSPTGGFLGLVAWLHAVCLALAALGLLAALVRLRRIDRASQVLVTGIVTVLAAGVFGTRVTSDAGAHEIAVLLPMGAALAARMVPAAVLRGRPLAGVIPVLAVLASCFLAALAIAASQSPVHPANEGLTRWLEAHGLHTGLAGYWQADSVNLDSGGRVLIAPLWVTQAGYVIPYRWEIVGSWFDPGATYANFMVQATDADGRQFPAISEPALYMRFGQPARVWHFENYTITVWNQNLLAHLDP